MTKNEIKLNNQIHRAIYALAEASEAGDFRAEDTAYDRLVVLSFQLRDPERSRELESALHAYRSTPHFWSTAHYWAENAFKLRTE